MIQTAPPARISILAGSVQRIAERQADTASDDFQYTVFADGAIGVRRTSQDVWSTIPTLPDSATLTPSAAAEATNQLESP